MEIVKSLNLNKNYKDVQNGSIVCAKNIITDDTGSYITTEPGLTSWFSKNNENIVGVIAIPNGCIIFTYNNSGNPKSKIYTKFEGSTTITYKNNVNWSYEGGIVEGTYSYNYKGDLIIAVNEYGVPNKQIPLKVFNLDDTIENDSLTLNQERVIPQVRFKISFNLNGSLVCGCYTFFIRYKIYDDNYTKWFQIGSDTYIMEPKIKDSIIHNYVNPNSFSDYLSTIATNYTNGRKLYTNENKYSGKGIIIELKEGTIPTSYQIGVIIKRNTETVGRIIGSYGNNTSIISIKDNSYIEDINVDEFLYNPTQYYNVKNAIAYNNRLYISNWEEYKNENITLPTISFSPTTKDPVNELYDFTSIYSLASSIKYNNDTIGTYNIDSDDLQVYSDNTIAQPSDILFRIIKNILPTANVKIHNEGNYNWTLNVGKQDLMNTIFEDQVIENGFDSIEKDGKPLLLVKIEHEIYFTVGGRKLLYDSLTDTLKEIRWLSVGSNNYVKAKWDDNSNEFSLNNVSFGIHCKVLRWFDRDEYGNYVRSQADILNYYITGRTTGSFDAENMSFSLTYTKTNTSQLQNDSFIEQSNNTTTPSIVTHRVNNRTFVPFQIYNFFIHFIRTDGSYTDGFKINPPQDFKIIVGGENYFVFNDSSYDGNWTSLIGCYVKVDSIPTGFVGYFISYEKIVETATNVVVVESLQEDSATNNVSLTNTQLIYGDNIIRGTKIAYLNNDSWTSLDASFIKYTNNRTVAPRVVYNIPSLPTNVKNAILYIDATNLQKIYTNETKTLYRLTNNIYNTEYSDDMFKYAPGFYTEEKVINYDKSDGVFFDATTQYILDKDGKETYYVFKINGVKNYSNRNLAAYNVKEDYKQGSYSRSYIKDDNQVTEIVYNKVLPPYNLSDFLEIQPCYTALPSKVYTNYSSSRIDKYNKTVRRSDILSDESGKIGFCNFAANEYKNILENKGDIVNLVGLGLYFIVHTEYSIFIFDRTPRLTKSASLDIPDVFDIHYKELLYSSNGFGGIKNKKESIVTKHGYIWLDKLNNYIFRFDEGKLGLLSNTINNFIKLSDINSCRFADDIQRDRLLTCLSFDGTNYITISYNFNTSAFISLHDYKFEEAFMSYYRCYLLSHERNSLHIYDVNSLTYDTLGNEETDIFSDKYYDNITKLSYIDIIINTNYESPKVLNSLSYVINELQTVMDKLFTSANITQDTINGSDFEYVNKYSGYKLQIFNDQTNTGQIDISLGNPHNPNPSPHSIYNQTGFDNLSEPYDKPWYDKGCWNFNYFRNITTKREISGSGSNITYSSVQDNSLIYGKYFIIRFYFDMSGIKPKLETINVNLNNY